MTVESLLAEAHAIFSGTLLNFGSIDFFSPQFIVLEVGILVLLVFFPLFLSTWMFYINEYFKTHIKWVLLEIKVPREIDKSPRAMEQVLSTIHSLRNIPTDVEEKYWIGEVTRWTSLEIVSIGGEIHFYIRLYYKQRSLFEAAFFSFYKDVELVEVDDYVDTFPQTVQEMYKEGYDLWGGELFLAKASAYPIKSYVDFEAIEEEKQFDPISSFLEVLAKVKPEERVAIQFLIAPAAAEWKKEYNVLIEKLKHQKKEGTTKTAQSLLNFPGGPLPALGTKMGEKGDEGFKELARTFSRSPGETNVLRAVENNLSKRAFKTIIRFVYFSPKSLFYDSFARRGIAGAFNQYADLDLNYFLINYRVATRTKLWNRPFFFPKTRNEIKKQRLLRNFYRRDLPPETVMGKVLTSSLWQWNIHTRSFQLSTESVATLFHPPTRLVLTAPHMVRVESRKTGPPAGLAIFGDEEKIEQFMGQ